jgi:hypothetical protein
VLRREFRPKYENFGEMQRGSWENNSRIDLKEIRCEDTDWIQRNIGPSVGSCSTGINLWAP